MARTVRIQSETQIYYLENYTVQQTYLFRPGDPFDRRARGALARAAALHGARVYAVTFLLNGFKMMADCPRLNLPEFMKSFQTQLARAVKDLYGWEGKVFERRYAKADILGEDGLLECFLEVSNAPIAAGLTPKIKYWGGINSYRNIMQDTPLAGVWLNHTELRRLERKTQNKRKIFKLPPNAGEEHHVLELTRLPLFKDLTQAKYIAELERLRAEHAKALREHRKKRGLGYMGSQKLRNLKWHHRPKEYAHFKRPLSYGPKKLRDDHRERVLEINREYAAAMRVYVRNKSVPKFPFYTCRPGLIKCEKPKGDETVEAVPA